MHLLEVILWILNVSVVLGQLNDNCQHGTLRLVNGSATYRGRLEICINNVWGSVCGNYYFQYYGTYNARVACRQLGYEVDGGQSVSYYGGAHYGQSTGPIWLNRLRCTGSENNLLDCNKAVDIGNTYDCSHSEDVSIVCPACSTGLVRLTDGLIPTEGTVEVCNHGAWTSVCDNGWGYQEAFVVCRQLGLPATDAQPVHYYNSFGYGHGIPTLNNWRCIGNESSLNDCLKSTSSCYYSYYSVRMYSISGVSCKGNIVPGNCSTGSMRLVGPNGPNKVEGRVEYCSNGVWSTVDSYGFDVRDAHVVCRRLGHQTPRALIFWNAYFGQGSGPVVFHNLGCTGSEDRLEHCSYSTSYYTSHTTDVGVKCSERVLTDCINGSVRLVNGTTPDEGRVEVCINGEWGTACSSYWDRRETKVVCKQLGYSQAAEGSVFIYSEFGDGDYQQILWNIQCTGSETNLASCNNYHYYYCYYGRTIGIKCYNISNCTHGEIKLYGGQSNAEGDLQICYNGVWVFVCHNWWIPPNVVCRQLGYQDTNWVSYSYYSFFGANKDVAPEKRIRFSCSGNENSLIHCHNYASNSYCGKAIGFTCSSVVNCSNGTIHLTDGEGDNEGRVEICTDGIWMTIDARYWNYNNAKVVCRQLGYYDTWSVAITDTSWSGKNERVGYRYVCTGTENKLSKCSKNSPSLYYANSWFNQKRGGVTCQYNVTENYCDKEGSIRLSNGGDSREGRVEICLNGYWGTVCSTGWDERDALVACTQVGHHTLRAIPVTNEYFGRGTGPVHMTGVDCTGNEESLTQCSYVNGIGATNCYHAKDVGVMCIESPIHYSVTIDTDTDAISIGNRVVLTCNVSPAPPVDSTYHWRSTVPGTSSFTQYRDTDPNVTLTINAGHTTHGNYYCIVKYNGAVIGRGHTVITVKELLQQSYSNIQYSNENGFVGILTVNTIDTTVTEYLLELNWYYNDNKILNSSKYLINNGNKTLVINNITDGDTGEYSVRFDGLRLYHYNKRCEDKLLQLLRGYPVLSPLIFIVSYNGIHNTPPMIHTHSITGFSNESSSVTLTNYLKEYSNEGSVSLYHNGNLLLYRVTSGILGSSSNPHYNYTINHPSITDSGYYEFQFVLNPFSELYSLNCPRSYQNFLIYSTFLRLYGGISLDQSVQKLEYYETPHFNFSSNPTSLIRDYNAQLSCSVSGGYPLYHNITLIKNGVAIANSAESELVYNTSGSSKYGLYQCAVDTTAQYIKKEILLEEEVQFTVQLNVKNCHKWNDAMLINALRNQTRHSCRCSADDVKFRDSDISCSNNVLSFSSIMIYAAMDGSRTASDLVSILLYDFESNKLLWINNMTALSIASPSDDDESSTTNEGLLIGLFVAGFVASFVIVLPINAGVCFWVKKHYKRFPHYDSNTEGDTVRYDNNKDFPQVMLKSKPQPKLSTVKMSKPQSPPVASEQRQKQSYERNEDIVEQHEDYEGLDMEAVQPQEIYEDIH